MSVVVIGSNVHSWLQPAMATTRRPRLPSHHATSHGVESGVAFGTVDPGAIRLRSCAPVPATVVTAPSARRTPRSTWLPESATTRS